MTQHDEKDLEGATPQRSIEAGQAVPTPELPHVETEMSWRTAALILGEHLAANGTDGYYAMDASQWLQWATAQIVTTPSTLTPERSAKKL